MTTASFLRHHSRPRVARRAFGVLLALLLAFGCQEPEPTPSAGSNTNWLIACDADAECTNGTSCLCGACTRACTSAASCGGLPESLCAQAAERAAISACARDAAGSGLCLPRCEPGSCGSEQACVGGACVLVPAPSLEFCISTAEASAEQRAFEEELLDALEQLRQAGGVSCSDGRAAAPSPPLRLDARLICAARALATDLNGTRVQSLVDSRGRTSQERFRAAGYTSRLWAESFALRVDSASDALAVMLSDADSCPSLVGAAHADVGVGRVGDVSVISLGSE